MEKHELFTKLTTSVTDVEIVRQSTESITARSCDMEGHARTCAERYCELAHRTVDQLFKVSTPCLDDHQIKPENMESVGELSEI